MAFNGNSVREFAGDGITSSTLLICGIAFNGTYATLANTDNSIALFGGNNGAGSTYNTVIGESAAPVLGGGAGSCGIFGHSASAQTANGLAIGRNAAAVGWALTCTKAHAVGVDALVSGDNSCLALGPRAQVNNGPGGADDATHGLALGADAVVSKITTGDLAVGREAFVPEGGGLSIGYRAQSGAAAMTKHPIVVGSDSTGADGTTTFGSNFANTGLEGTFVLACDGACVYCMSDYWGFTRMAPPVYPRTINTIAGTATLSAAACAQSSVIVYTGAVGSITTATHADIVATAPIAPLFNGHTWFLWIRNSGSGTVTLLAGAGVTVTTTGSTTTNTTAAGRSSLWFAHKSAGATTFRKVGTFVL
jgi:hypothetical protein